MRHDFMSEPAQSQMIHGECIPLSSATRSSPRCSCYGVPDETVLVFIGSYAEKGM
jgi:hypothetical protein